MLPLPHALPYKLVRSLPQRCCNITAGQEVLSCALTHIFMADCQVGIDAAPEPGLRGPTNFHGVLDAATLGLLDGELKGSQSYLRYSTYDPAFTLLGLRSHCGNIALQRLLALIVAGHGLRKRHAPQQGPRAASPGLWLQASCGRILLHS